MAIIEQTTAYLERLFGDPKVQQDLDRSLLRARQAGRRAKLHKSTKAAVKDEGVRMRLRQSFLAARSAAVQLKRGPEVQQRRRRRKPVYAAGAVLSAAVVAALYGDLRDQLARATSPSPEQSQGA
jgi:hypothetical protein